MSEFNIKDLKLVGNRITYQGVVVGTMNDLDMSKQRFEFQDFLKSISSDEIFKENYDDGYEKGYDDGYEKGYDDGKDENN